MRWRNRGQKMIIKVFGTPTGLKQISGVEVFRLSDISILVQVHTDIKWPGVSFGSGYSDGITSQHIMIHRSETAGRVICTVELHPEQGNEWERIMLDRGHLGKNSVRYGPTVFYTLIPDNLTVIGGWKGEGKEDG